MPLKSFGFKQKSKLPSNISWSTCQELRLTFDILKMTVKLKTDDYLVKMGIEKTFDLLHCYYHVTYAFLSESTFYS